MIALIQRVGSARVDVDGSTVAEIGTGLLLLLGVERGDQAAQAERLCDRVLGYRVFADSAGKMNLDVRSAGGALLVVPQFTLAADTGCGRRPSFTSAAPPALGEPMFEHFVAHARATNIPVETGIFGADMAVHLHNDGPVTFWLQVSPEA